MYFGIYPLVLKKISCRYNKYYYRFKDSIIVSDIYADVSVSYSIEIDVQEMLHQI